METAVLLLVVSVSTLLAETRKISQTELKSKWPFTIDTSEIECRTGQVLLFRDGARIYALNGTAKTRMPKLSVLNEPATKRDLHAAEARLTAQIRTMHAELLFERRRNENSAEVRPRAKTHGRR